MGELKGGIEYTSSGEPSVVPASHLPIRLASLRLDTLTGFDLYLQAQPGQAPVLYRERGLPFTDEARQRLLDHGVEMLYIDKSAEREYQRYIEQHLSEMLNDPAIDISTKSDLLYHSAIALVEEVMEDPRAGDVIPRSRSFVDSTCRFMRADRRALASLMRVTSYDYYTYTHSVNVFVFTVSLVQRARVVDVDLLPRVGEGALLHDIGKSMIDPSIVNCRGKLSAEQWKAMRMHPVLACTILSEQGVTDPVVLSVVRNHHEKRSGNGYPDGIPADGLPPYTRACTIADIFDALTTRRSYKNAMASFEALKLMRDEMRHDLDPDLFRVFVGMMGNPEGE